MAHWNRMETDERFVIRIEQRPFVRHAIDRIRPIENDNVYARFLAGAHAEIQTTSMPAFSQARMQRYIVQMKV